MSELWIVISLKHCTAILILNIITLGYFILILRVSISDEIGLM